MFFIFWLLLIWHFVGRMHSAHFHDGFENTLSICLCHFTNRTNIQKLFTIRTFFQLIYYILRALTIDQLKKTNLSELEQPPIEFRGVVTITNLVIRSNLTIGRQMLKLMFQIVVYIRNRDFYVIFQLRSWIRP